MQALRSRTATAALLAVGPALLGALLALGGARTGITLVLLWMEPLLLAAALYGALYLAWERRTADALALLAGATAAVIVLHQPAAPTPVDGGDATWSARLRECAQLPGPPQGEVRVLTWTVGATPLSADDLRAIEDQRPDLVVLFGAVPDGAARSLAARLEGESKRLPGASPSGGLVLVARGGFRYCGGREDVWEMPLPRHAGGTARAVLSFPDVRGVGVVPLVAVQLDRPGPPGDWVGWPRRVTEGATRVGALVQGLGPDRMLVVADAPAPRTARQISAPLQGAGLEPLVVPATWPDRLGPLPALPLHALDRAWVGGRWSAPATHTVRAGSHDRRALLLRLQPR